MYKSFTMQLQVILECYRRFSVTSLIHSSSDRCASTKNLACPCQGDCQNAHLRCTICTWMKSVLWCILVALCTSVTFIWYIFCCCRKQRWRRVFCRTRRSTVVSGSSPNCFTASTVVLRPRRAALWWWEVQAAARRPYVVSWCGRPRAHVHLHSLNTCSHTTSVRLTTLKRCRWLIFCTAWPIRYAEFQGVLCDSYVCTCVKDHLLFWTLESHATVFREAWSWIVCCVQLILCWSI